MEDINILADILRNFRQWHPVEGLGNLFEGLAYVEAERAILMSFGSLSEEYRYLRRHYHMG